MKKKLDESRTSSMHQSAKVMNDRDEIKELEVQLGNVDVDRRDTASNKLNRTDITDHTNVEGVPSSYSSKLEVVVGGQSSSSSHEDDNDSLEFVKNSQNDKFNSQMENSNDNIKTSNHTQLGKGDDDDAVSQGTTWIVKGSAADDMQSDGSYMQRVDGNESEGSYMVRAGNGTMADDLSSQGSYMVKMGGNADGGFTDMQSEGSYMARGFNG